MKRRQLRSGYTTGACAAAAAKAAAIIVIRNALSVMSNNLKNDSLLITHHASRITDVEIPFPDGSRVKFKIQDSRFKIQDGHLTATASVIKDAGDDPDVTNGAEIVATVKVRSEKLEMRSEHPVNTLFSDSHFPLPTSHLLIIKGGKGVGVVTKPGLSVPVGEPAINPVPREMIKEAVMEALSNQQGGDCPRFTGEAPVFNGAGSESGLSPTSAIEVTISVPDGEKLAKKTLNQRLGIIGGISILGTTGIVKPISSDAWTATIRSSMDVAKAMGQNEIVLSAGRASELAHMKKYNLPEECYVMMGDYLEFSLLEAKKHEFKKIHLCAQWAKMLKIAMATPQTHVRHGAIDLKKAVEFLKKLDNISQFTDHEFNTAREILDFINSSLVTCHSSLFLKVCNAAKKYAEKISPGIPVNAHLVSYEGDIIEISE
ncbi:MAG: cobalt-precorrin-5B (C(1))-methyltransferase CbiD [Thermodesulfovibrionales bacterium]